MAIIPISCKSGVVILNSQHVLGEAWSASLEIENDEYKHFEMTPDANTTPLIWAQLLTSFAKGNGTCRMKFDNTPGSRPITNKNLFLDTGGVGYLGYTSTVGFVIAYTIVGVEGGSDTAQPSSTVFNLTFKITACTFTITGP